MSRRRYNKKSIPGKNIVFATIVSFFLIAVIVAFFLYFEREEPQVAIAGDVGLIGVKKDYTLKIDDQKSGIKQVEIKVRQNDLEKVVKTKTFDRESKLPSAGPKSWKTTLKIDTEQLGLKDGSAELIVNVHDFSLWNLFRGNLTSRVYPLTVDTKPPEVRRMSSSRYIKPGGAGIVIYTVKEDSLATHGVRLNGDFHQGIPLPEKNNYFIAMIGLPYDTKEVTELWVEAKDRAGNVGQAKFGLVLKRANKKQDRINVSDSFLDWKIPEFSSYLKGVAGDKLKKYLYINEIVRNENNSKIKELCADPADERYWEGRFLRMPGKRMSGYADHRTYYYKGKAVDEQVHLGVDLASFQHADVEAANNGKVKYADYLGIYGNTIIIDHGYGLFSLYAHLNDMLVNPGDLVEKGQKIGVTDTTGMAGGDHLHFSMLVNGIFVDPLEWWDSHWIEVNILSYLR